MGKKKRNLDETSKFLEEVDADGFEGEDEEVSLYEAAHIPRYDKEERRSTITLTEEQIEALLERYALISAKKTVAYLYFDLNRKLGLKMTSLTYKMLGGLGFALLLWILKKGELLGIPVP